MKTIELKFHKGKRIWLNLDAIAAIQEHAELDDWCYVHLVGGARLDVNHPYDEIVIAIASCVALASQ